MEEFNFLSKKKKKKKKKKKEINHENVPLWFLMLTPVVVISAIPITYYLLFKDRSIMQIISKRSICHFITFYIISGISMNCMRFYSSKVLKKIGLFFWKSGDQNTIDRYGPDGISKLVKKLSDKVVKFQTGFIMITPL